MNEFHTSIIPQLQTVVPQTIQQVSLWGSATSWSVVYRLDLEDGTSVFAKGTPRQRNEAAVIRHLNLLSETAVPRVLITDLLSTACWQWFLLEDAGGTAATQLTLAQAVIVAQTLGQLQRMTQRDAVLPSLLPDCSANNLHAQILALCHWALTEQASPWQEEVCPLVHALEQASPVFADLAAVLAEVPATIIHGDLWAGNLVLTDHGVCFLDWGDALWGIGGTSLVHLLWSQKNLEEAEPLLWEAYQQGLGVALSQDYRRACGHALDIIDLVVDQAIANSCGQGPSWLPGLLPGLRRIVAWVHGSSATQEDAKCLQ
jgi:fructosamine-3-kinase